jgi:urease accessory protein UreF
MIDSAGFSGSYFATGTGKTFGIAGVFAVIAAVFNFGVARPTMERAVRVGAALASAADAGEKARLTQELDRLRKRGAMAGMLAVTFGILAASGMAVARYV